MSSAERRRQPPPRRPGVLITRPDAGADATARLVSARGFAPIVAPLMAVRPLPSYRIPRSDALQAVLLTSANALTALEPALHGVKVFAVGDATATRARSAGFSDVTSAGGNALDLYRLVMRSCTPAGLSLLLPTARGEGGELARVLREAGFDVLQRSVYAAVPQNQLPRAAVDALASGAVDIALFFSPATSRNFVQLLPAALPPECLNAVDAIALSEKVAAPLAVLPWRRILISPKPTQKALLALLAEQKNGGT